MRMFKKLNAALALALTLALVTPVAVPVSPVAVAEAATVKINKKKKSLKVGKSFKLKIKGTKETVTWESSDTSVATVNKKGKVTAIAPGKATITATVGDQKFTCKVTVKDDTNPAVAAAPYEAKEAKTFSYTTVIPKDWSITKTEVNGITAYAVLPANSEELAGGANILVTSTENVASTQENFELLKTYVEGFLTQEYIQETVGADAAISNFLQEEVEINLGKALKTSYTLTMEAEGETLSVTQTIYDIFADGYTTEITVTTGLVPTTPDVNVVGEYMAKSLTFAK